MNMKQLQQMQADAKNAEGELRSQLQNKCREAIIDILKSAGLDNTAIDVSRLADAWHENLMHLLEQINFIN